MTLLIVNAPESVMAQITQDGHPRSFNVKVEKQAAFVEIPVAPRNWEEIMFEQAPSLKPYLFAWPVEIQINVIEPDNLVFVDDQYEIYKLNIHTDDAYSLNIIFNKFLLPDGVQVFLYDPDRNVINGAYTALNNKKSRMLATSPVPGNYLVIEVDVDKSLAAFSPKLVIEQVSLDNKNAFGYKSGFGKSGDCNVDINCPQGADWQLEKRAVCKFIRGGSWLCSGALINNTANDGRALLLTAHHCIQTAFHARTSVFYFKYESPSCYGVDGPINFSISSSNLLATTNKLDFALVELSLTPPESYEPYYAGWDRNKTVFVDTVTCIHHPSGDVKKISGSYRRITTGDFGGGFDENTHWHIAEWDYGTTEGGSSGSPLFNNSHKIIGDLTGGDASCTYNFNDYFEKLWISWDRYPGQDKQLKAW
ncbi:MAG: trypsin-like peptidase domain-containing protein, partial [Bacteroidales bacterium]|nr:trypsin-like peptidase domain-containing protein [Bacteroidales bacterium]